MNAPLTINRARLVGATARRGDVERWLGQVPLETLGLEPEEVLYVPRLALSLPAGLGGPHRSVAWAFAARLRALLEGAERDPMAAPTGESACRFSSRARYLAWLAMLWLRGGARGRFVAPAVTGRTSFAEWQQAALLRDGAALVPVVAHLAEAGLAGRWLAGLGAAETAMARRALADRFGLDLERMPPLPPPDGHPRRTRSRRASEQSTLPTSSPPPAAELTKIAGRMSELGNDWPALAPEARAILIAAMVLYRAPASGLRPTLAADIAAVAADPRRAEFRHRGSWGAATAVPSIQPSVIPPALRGSRPGNPRPTAVRAVGSGDAAPPAPSTPLAPRAARAASREAGQQPRRPGLSGGVANPGPTQRPPPPAAAPATDEGLASDYAGLLFLLNAFVALGLYPDFTGRPRALVKPSPLWLADRIGRRWFGARYRRDPLCGWIGGQARGGPLPRSWAVGRDWAAGFGPSAAPVRVEQDGRVTLWHRAGFPLADGRAEPPRRLRDLARRCGCIRRPVEAVRSDRRFRLPGNSDARWIHCLGLYLDARLRLATGDPAFGLSALALPGEIRVRDLELIVRFRLDSHPIGLRIAGLDRDLGWHPAEGRSIGFRFE